MATPYFNIIPLCSPFQEYYTSNSHYGIFNGISKGCVLIKFKQVDFSLVFATFLCFLKRDQSLQKLSYYQLFEMIEKYC